MLSEEHVRSQKQISKDMGRDTPFIKKYNSASKSLENGYIESIYSDFVFLGKFRDYTIIKSTGAVLYKNIKLSDINEYFSSSIPEIFKIHGDDEEVRREYLKLICELDDFYIQKSNSKTNRKK